VRDVASAVAAFGVLGVEAWRGTYNPVAMVVVLTLLGVASTGTVARWLDHRNGNGKPKP
jgi:multisubunit Na+/H+ antiporter MnhF subunit